MSGQQPTGDWTATPTPPARMDIEHSAEIDGLTAEITEEHEGNRTYVRWWVRGYLADTKIAATSGTDYLGFGRTLDQAKGEVTAAARRLLAAGVRGSISYVVSCCDRLFVTRDAADQHEEEHRAASAGGPSETVADMLRRAQYEGRTAEVSTDRADDVVAREDHQRESAASETLENLTDADVIDREGQG